MLTNKAATAIAAIAAVTLGAASATAAADLVVEEPSATVTPSEPGDWYVSLFVGAAKTDDTYSTFYGTHYVGTFDTGYNLGLAVGRSLGDSFRAEIELSNNRVTADYVTGWAVTFPASGSLSTAYLLGNMWYDLPTGFSVTPYIGGGIGAGYASSNTYFGFTRYGYGPGNLGFAYQLGAGVKFDASEDIALDLGYRYKSILGIDYRDTDPLSVFEDPDIHTHVLQAGLTFKF